MSYLLLTTFNGPGGEQNKWETFDSLIKADRVLQRIIEDNKKLGWLAGIHAPALVKYSILEIKEVTKSN